MTELSGWLSPDGVFFQQFGGHTLCAEEIGHNIYHLNWIKAEKQLHRRKWVRIAGCGLLAGPRKITDRQWLFLYTHLYRCYVEGERQDYISNMEYSMKGWWRNEPQNYPEH